MQIFKEFVMEHGDSVFEVAEEGPVAFFQWVCDASLSSFHVFGELSEGAWEAQLLVPRLLLVSKCETSHYTTWLSEGEPDQISVSQMVSVSYPFGKPAVLTPPQEASVSTEEECPEVENESNQFKHQSLVIPHHMRE